MLIDSDVMVWLARGHPGAIERLRQVPQWRISVVTYIELAQGCRDKEHLRRLKAGLGERRTEILPVDAAISQRAVELIELLALSHGLRLADALIAATALLEGAVLLTGNVKHFSAVPGLAIEAFAPG